MLLLLIYPFIIALYIYLIRKNFSRKKFYTTSLITNILLGSLSLWVIGTDGWAGVFVGYSWFALYVLLCLAYLIFEIKHKPVEPINTKKFQITLIIYGIIFIIPVICILYFIPISKLLDDVASLSILFYLLIILALVASVFYTYFLLKKGRSSFYILFLILNIIILPVCLLIYPNLTNFKRINENMEKREAFLQSVSKGSYEDCLKSSSSLQCNMQFSKTNRDPSYCLKLNDADDVRYSERYDCIFELAQSSLDSNFCKFYNTPGKKAEVTHCRKYSTSYFWINPVSMLTTEEIIEKGIEENNSDICLGIKSDEGTAECQMAILLSSSTSTIKDCDSVIKILMQKTQKISNDQCREKMILANKK